MDVSKYLQTLRALMQLHYLFTDCYVLAVHYPSAEKKVQQNTCPEITFIIYIDLILYPLCYTTQMWRNRARGFVDQAKMFIVINDRMHWRISRAVTAD